MKKKKQNWDYTLKGKSKRLLLNKRRECNQKNIPFDLDEQWISKRIENGCELTGLPFKLDASKKPHSLSPSIDRINPKMGYIKNNCRMILHSVNMFKYNDSDPVMFYIADKLLKNRYIIVNELENRTNKIGKQEYDNISVYYHLRQFFTERQIEIISKKYNNETLNKTEAEYYSRTIKKRLKAITNKDIFRISKQIIETS